MPRKSDLDKTPPTRWWWVRHAPVVVNNGCCYGQDDLPCTVADVARFRGLAKHLPEDAVWVVSNLMRTHQTAAAIVAAGLRGPDPIPGPDVVVEPGLAEQHLGHWQGQTYAALAEQQGEAYHRFWFAPARERAPGGESFVDLIERVATVIHRLNQDYAGRDIIAVTHGGTIRAAMGLALDVSPETALSFTIDNLSLTQLDHFDDPTARHGHRWRVAGVNLTAA
jgi:broad specificity phosphatase PhoE